jgi:hypothetical protein
MFAEAASTQEKSQSAGNVVSAVKKKNKLCVKRRVMKEKHQQNKKDFSLHLSCLPHHFWMKAQFLAFFDLCLQRGFSPVLRPHEKRKHILPRPRSHDLQQP